MCCGLVGVVTKRTFLNLYTGEEEKFLLQRSDVFFFELTHEDLRSITRVTSVFALVFYLGNAAVKLHFVDLQATAKRKRVPLFPHVTHGERHLIDRLVENQKLTISIENQSSGRVDSLFDQRVIIRLVFR